ncbi:glycosyltransferase [Bacillus sp. JCM 19041]|uniref:glycosyltransferase n=1 Tax=Bacillus sp. JCM 19041 TaxID=1460637 RepID=UPI0006D2564C
MLENKVFLVTYGIGPESGGVTVATLNQSKMFTDANYDVSITTFDYNRDYDQIFNDLERMNRVYKDVNHKNKYEYYATKNNPKGDVDESVYLEELPVYEESCQSLFNEENQSVKIFKNGELIKEKLYDEKQNLISIDYYNKTKVKVRRYEFSKKKYPLIQQFFNESTGVINRESFYTSDGFCYLTRYHNEKGDPGEVYLFNRVDNSVMHFAGNKEHDRHWLNELAIEGKINDKLPLFITNGQGSGSKVMSIDKKRGKKVFFVHSNHFKEPFTYGSVVKKKYNYVFKRIKKFDAIIVLSEKQKQDIKAQYGEHSNIFVIPNAISINDYERGPRKDGSVIMVTRLEPEKSIERAIKMFPLVVEKVPNAELNIFGKGSLKEELEKCIKDNDMEEHVFLRGYSRNVKQELKRATLSLLTSKFEGLPLAAVESLESATPVVSYDFNYGAADIIDDEETGYVVEHGDEETLAEKVTHLLNNPQLADNMGFLGRKRMIDRYASDAVYRKWMNMLNELEVSSKK